MLTVDQSTPLGSWPYLDLLYNIFSPRSGGRLGEDCCFNLDRRLLHELFAELGRPTSPQTPPKPPSFFHHEVDIRMGMGQNLELQTLVS